METFYWVVIINKTHSKGTVYVSLTIIRRSSHPSFVKFIWSQGWASTRSIGFKIFFGYEKNISKIIFIQSKIVLNKRNHCLFKKIIHGLKIFSWLKIEMPFKFFLDKCYIRENLFRVSIKIYFKSFILCKIKTYLSKSNINLQN